MRPAAAAAAAALRAATAQGSASLAAGRSRRKASRCSRMAAGRGFRRDARPSPSPARVPAGVLPRGARWGRPAAGCAGDGTGPREAAGVPRRRRRVRHALSPVAARNRCGPSALPPLSAAVARAVFLSLTFSGGRAGGRNGYRCALAAGTCRID
jgi:hypothetical protein